MARDERSQLGTNWSRKSTYPADVVLLLPKELHGALEVGFYRAAEVEPLLPDLFLLVLGADEVLGDASLLDLPARPSVGRPGWTNPEIAPESSRNLAAGAGLAERGA